MAVRLRPQNAEERMADADFADCVELQSEVHFGHLSVDSALYFDYGYSFLDLIMHKPCFKVSPLFSYISLSLKD